MSENRQCAGRTGAECAIISRCFVTDSDERTRLVNDEQDEDEQGDKPRDVLTKPKILPVEIKWERIEDGRHNRPKRYVLSALTYQRLLDAVPKERS